MAIRSDLVKFLRNSFSLNSPARIEAIAEELKQIDGSTHRRTSVTG